MESLLVDSLHLKVVLIFAVGFGFASLFGYISHSLKLSPVVGYLLAGYLIGPYSPGFVADLQIAEQLAEVGVILMMFSVGLHMRWEDLFSVRKIAIPGALAQTCVSAAVGTLLVYGLGWSIQAGIILGFSIGVASTVILVRILLEHQLLQTEEGHISLGWLIVEDVMTVGLLLLLPVFASSVSGKTLNLSNVAMSIGVTGLKLGFLILFMMTVGHKLVHRVISKVSKSGSEELFTLAVLAMTFAIALISALLFNTSIAFGAFIAGMAVSQSTFRQQVSTNLLSLKDIFVVIFFLSVGTLFNPTAIVNHFSLFISVLTIILLIKPMVAFAIMRFSKYPVKTSLIVAVALAQIGEFSFILAEQANHFGIIPDEGYDIIVACALVSISLNPLLFKIIKDIAK